jgi:predicted ribosome quality control (RQC) complex YloA/Tae2 family protein
MSNTKKNTIIDYVKKQEDALQATEDTQAEYKKTPTLLTSKQALVTIAGNQSRLLVFVEKVYKGSKTLEEWRDVFSKDGLL